MTWWSDRSTKWRVVWVVGASAILLACAVLATVLIWRADEAESRRELDALRADLRGAGYPVTPEDLLETPPPDSENAAVPLRALFDELAAAAAATRDFLGNDALMESEAEILAGYDPLIRKLREAMARPACDFQIAYRGPETEVPHYRRIMEASWLLQSRIVERAREGDLPGAFQDLRALSQLSGATAREETASSQFIRYGQRGTALRLLRFLLPLADDPVAELEQVGLADLRGSSGMELRGQLVLLVGVWADDPPTVREIVRLPRESQEEETSEWFWQPGKRRGLVHMGRFIKRVLDSEGMPYPERLALTESIVESTRSTALGSLPERMVGIGTPELFFSLRMEAQAVSETALARVAAALLAHRMSHGAFPERLGDLDLQPEALVDPFTENPFRYVRRAEGTWIASERAFSTPWGEELDPFGDDANVLLEWALWQVDAVLPPRPTERDE